MKRRKKHAAKGRKTKKKGPNVSLRAEAGRHHHTGSRVEFAVRRVEEALDNLPPGTLSKSKAEEIRRKLPVVADEAAKPKDRKTALDRVIKICRAIKVTGDAIQVVHDLWNDLQELIELISSYF